MAKAKRNDRPAMDYLFQFIVPEETGLLKARELIQEFIRKIEKQHEPILGECYPEDRNRYCAICLGPDGGSARHPCGTIRAVRSFLGDAEKQSR